MHKAGLAAFAFSTCLSAQVPPPLPEADLIRQYVGRVEADKTLAISQVFHHPRLIKSAFNYPMVWGADTLFWTYNTDYPCSALLYRSPAGLVKIKEIINVGSAFAVNYYYLQHNQLAFLEAKEILIPFQKQSPKAKYTEKDYAFHGRYFFAGDSCIYSEERGKGPVGFGRFPIPTRKPAQPRAYFYCWQANRYVDVLKQVSAN